MSVFVVAMLTIGGVSKAEAWANSGLVYCDTNQNGMIDEIGDTPLSNVRVTARSADGSFFAEAFTDSTGHYIIFLPGAGTYTFAIDTSTIPGGAALLGTTRDLNPPNIPPAVSSITINVDETFNPYVYYLADSAACAGAQCWLTAGGVKFEPLVGATVAVNGPRESFGGNVYPGCNADNGNNGGQWNHVSHVNKLHFQGTQIEVVSCGNVVGIPPGSTSPVTPVNFIEFRGTGRLNGINGNKDDFGEVQFFARVEDRGEPGNEKGNKGPTLDTDRYFLRVFNSANPALLLVDIDGDPSTVDPLTITGGNLQLHFKPCPEQ